MTLPEFLLAVMLEDSPTAMHNAAWCHDCGVEWSGAQALIDGTFHQQTTGHRIECAARVCCHDSCCNS